MLRITKAIDENSSVVTLTLEGRLAAEWVALLEPVPSSIHRNGEESIESKGPSGFIASEVFKTENVLTLTD